MPTAALAAQRKVCESENIKLMTVTEGSAESPHGSFEGYASVFNNKDRQNEIVLPGAYKDSLESFKANGFIAIGHDWKGLPVATISEAYEDQHGLYIKADFHSDPESQRARTILQERLARGKSARLSIGYRVLDDQKSAEGRLLKKLDLFEVSIVTVPANPLAYILGAKSEDSTPEGYELDETEDLNSLLAGQTFEKHFTTVHAATEVLLERFKNIKDLRAKEGRSLSRANTARLASMRQTLSSMLSEVDRMMGVTQEGEGGDAGKETEPALTLTPADAPGKGEEDKEEKTETVTQEPPKEEDEAAKTARLERLRSFQLELIKKASATFSE